MRVISGTARSLPLKTVKSMKTRPTQDRIKETLFNILQPDIPDSVFLDLFSGSGGIGIEALSRGAREAVFVEKDREAVSCIEYNLSFTHLRDRARVLKQDVLTAVPMLSGEGHGPFGIIFMDPPYGLGLETEALRLLRKSGLLSPDTLIIVEASMETDPEPMEALGYRVLRIKNYKTNRHLFLTPETEIL